VNVAGVGAGVALASVPSSSTSRFGISGSTSFYDGATGIGAGNTSMMYGTGAHHHLDQSYMGAAPSQPVPPKNLSLQGIVYDLEEIETGEKTFPLTLAFCELLLELLYATPIPSMLGSGYRTPGIQPYLDFLEKHVFLKMDDRSYTSSVQRWKIVRATLGIFCRLLDDFDPEMLSQSSDADGHNHGGNGLENMSRQNMSMSSFYGGPFAQNSSYLDTSMAAGNSSAAVSRNHALRSPGLQLMKQMCSTDGSNFFRKLLDVLARSSAYLEEEQSLREDAAAAAASGSSSSSSATSKQTVPSTSDDKKKNDDADRYGSTTASILDGTVEHDAVEGSLLLVMKLLATSLSKEHTFLDSLRKEDRDSTLDYVSSMLIKYQKHVVAIAKSMCHVPQDVFVDTTGEGQLPYYASKVMYALSERDSQLLVNIFNQNDATLSIIQSTAAFLRSVPPLPTQHRESARAAALMGRGVSPYDDFMDDEDEDYDDEDDASSNQTYLNDASVTLVHILLKNLNQPDFNLCLLLLGFSVDANFRELDLTSDPSKRALLDQLLAMVSKTRFSAQYPSLAEACYQLFHALTIHRVTSKPFLKFVQLHHELFFLNTVDMLSRHAAPLLNPRQVPTSLMQHAWLLKAVAAELRISSADVQSWNDYVRNSLTRLGFIHVPEEVKLNLAGPSMDVEQRGMKVLELLQFIDVASRFMPADPPTLPDTIQGTPTSEFKRLNGPHSFTYDIKGLYSFASQTLPPDEVHQLCSDALQWNQMSALEVACRDAFQGWSQCVEVSLDVYIDIQDQFEESDTSFAVLFELLKALLNRLNVRENRVWSMLSEAVGAVALTTISKIRTLANLASVRRQAQEYGVLQLIVDAIIRNPYHLTRAYLYGVFLNYIQYSKEASTSHKESVDQQGRGFGDTSVFDSMGGGSSSVHKNEKNLRAHNREFLDRVGPQLVHVVCQDAADGQARLRSMSFLCLNALLSEATHDDSRLLGALSRKDALRYFVSDIANRDRLLCQAVLSTDLQNYDSILYFESLASLFVRTATLPSGPTSLVDAGILQTLASCNFLKRIPEASRNADVSPAFASIPPIERYYQLLNPTLQLTVAMLAARQNNRSLHLEVLEFIKSHDDVLKTVLKSAKDATTVSALTAAKLVTALFYFLYSGPLAFQSQERSMSSFDRAYAKQHGGRQGANESGLDISASSQYRGGVNSSFNGGAAGSAYLDTSYASASGAGARSFLVGGGDFGNGEDGVVLWGRDIGSYLQHLLDLLTHFSTEFSKSSFRAGADPDGDRASALLLLESKMEMDEDGDRDPLHGGSYPAGQSPSDLRDEVCRNLSGILWAISRQTESGRLFDRLGPDFDESVPKLNFIGHLLDMMRRVITKACISLEENKKFEDALLTDIHSKPVEHFESAPYRLDLSAGYSRSQKLTLAQQLLKQGHHASLHDLRQGVYIVETLMHVLFDCVEGILSSDRDMIDQVGNLVNPFLKDFVMKKLESQLKEASNRQKPSHLFIYHMVRKFQKRLPYI